MLILSISCAESALRRAAYLRCRFVRIPLRDYGKGRILLTLVIIIWDSAPSCQQKTEGRAVSETKGINGKLPPESIDIINFHVL